MSAAATTHTVATGDDRLADCHDRLEQMAGQTPEQQADAIEFVHAALTAELDDLRGRERPRNAAPH